NDEEAAPAVVTHLSPLVVSVLVPVFFTVKVLLTETLDFTVPKSVKSVFEGDISPSLMTTLFPRTSASGAVVAAGTVSSTEKVNGFSSESLLLNITVCRNVPAVAEVNLIVKVSNAPGAIVADNGSVMVNFVLVALVESTIFSPLVLSVPRPSLKTNILSV